MVAAGRADANRGSARGVVEARPEAQGDQGPIPGWETADRVQKLGVGDPVEDDRFDRFDRFALLWKSGEAFPERQATAGCATGIPRGAHHDAPEPGLDRAARGVVRIQLADRLEKCLLGDILRFGVPAGHHRGEAEHALGVGAAKFLRS